ncbi:MAG: CmcJ/NvfI family oxidoreductase, partial [Gammaproteobacteria bacterium]
FMLLKCFDSLTDGRARFMPHTGFKNPDCPPEYTPRESIEARTLVIM